MKADEKHAITILKGGKKTGIKPERISYIVEEVAYWRKANAIHNWFVKNIQNDDDDCGNYDVSRTQLEELRLACQKVIAVSKLKKGKIKNGRTFKDGKWVDILEDGEYIEDAIIAHGILPTASGFFFGSTDYDRYYLDDIKYTFNIFTELLQEKNEGHVYFQYHSSW